MTSFQLSVSLHRRVAARFVNNVRRRLQRAYAEAANIKQTDIARELGVHRSVINRQLRGYKDMTVGRVAELSWALGYEPSFSLIPLCHEDGVNLIELPAVFKTKVEATESQKRIEPSRTLETVAQ